jgi:5,5'-dehydrodivanillate O-demethylase oxygenase subunit
MALTKEQNERLTQVGPGTPMGKLLRRYWQVVGTAYELDQDPVQPVRLLGEDLVLFRDAAGTLGLVGNRCAHRGISLAYGIPQDNGLRCAYHGWTYNSAGQVVDMPFEPACLPLKIASYPVLELGGLIWTYMGPPETQPLLPRWDLLVRTDLTRQVGAARLPMSFLQAMENSFDPVHFEHLHGVFGNYVMKKLGKPPAMTPARHLKIEFAPFEYGIYKRRLLEGDSEDNEDWTHGHPVLFPNILTVNTGADPMFQIRVPVDDETTMAYWYFTKPLPEGEPPRTTVPVWPNPFRNPDGTLKGDTTNAQDMLAWVAQGPIADRTQEHLVTSDKGILLYRKTLLEQIEKVERGEDPMGTIRDAATNEPMIELERESFALKILDVRFDLTYAQNAVLSDR